MGRRDRPDPARTPRSTRAGRPPGEAEADFQAAADILAGLGERWGEAVALGGLDGRPGLAWPAFLQAFELIKPMGMTQQLGAVAATGLGYLAAAEGDLAAARDWHARAMENARASADASVIAEALDTLAALVAPGVTPGAGTPAPRAKRTPP